MAEARGLALPTGPGHQAPPRAVPAAQRAAAAAVAGSMARRCNLSRADGRVQLWFWSTQKVLLDPQLLTLQGPFPPSWSAPPPPACEDEVGEDRVLTWQRNCWRASPSPSLTSEPSGPKYQPGSSPTEPAGVAGAESGGSWGRGNGGGGLICLGSGLWLSQACILNSLLHGDPPQTTRRAKNPRNVMAPLSLLRHLHSVCRTRGRRPEVLGSWHCIWGCRCSRKIWSVILS